MNCTGICGKVGLTNGSPITFWAIPLTAASVGLDETTIVSEGGWVTLDEPGNLLETEDLEGD